MTSPAFRNTPSSAPTPQGVPVSPWTGADGPSPPGVSAIEVEDGQSAIDLLSLRSFDLILLSLDLPIMTGADVVRWVRRSQTQWSDIPILGLVSDAERDGLGRVISSGLTDWTPKPINRQHLTGKLIGLMPNLAGTGL